MNTTFTIALVATVAQVSADHYQEWDIKQDYGSQLHQKYFASKEWSQAPTDRYNTTVYNNNSIMIKNDPYDGAEYAYRPLVRGGSVHYDVDLSQTDCGCVAGLYLVPANGQCGGEDAGDLSGCQNIDVMQANRAGFNVAANPCANGSCDAVSQCQYNVAVEGKAKYGDGAYGPSGSLIDTDRPFSVMTEFVSTKDYRNLWKIRTTLKQDGDELQMEAVCPENYLSPLDYTIEGNMGFVVSSWDNRDGANADFECKGTCPQAADTCEYSQVSIENFMAVQAYSNEDPEPTPDPSPEPSPEPTPEPAFNQPFIGYTDMFGDFEFYVKGLDGGYLETDNQCIKMGYDNRAFVRDMAIESDDTFWAYHHKYLGGTVEFDVDVKDVGCACAAGVYLTSLANEGCTWNPYPGDVRPRCATVDVMEANCDGFNVASHPCEFDQCEEQSMSKGSASDVSADAYGMGSGFKIDTTKSYRVKTQFFAAEGEMEYEYTELKRIVTTLTQGDNEVVIEQDNEDYLQPLAFKLFNEEMSLAISSFNVGTDNEIADSCDVTCSSESVMEIKNIRWTTNDAHIEKEEEEDVFTAMGPAESLSQCEPGCTECHKGAWSSAANQEAYVCVDTKVYRYGNACRNKKANTKVGKKCNSGDDALCHWSTEFGTTGDAKRATGACRTIPDQLITSEMKYGNRQNSNQTKGLCKYGCDDGKTCNWSWCLEDTDKWKGASAMFRCKA